MDDVYEYLTTGEFVYLFVLPMLFFSIVSVLLILYTYSIMVVKRQRNYEVDQIGWLKSRLEKVINRRIEGGVRVGNFSEQETFSGTRPRNFFVASLV